MAHDTNENINEDITKNIFFENPENPKNTGDAGVDSTKKEIRKTEKTKKETATGGNQVGVITDEIRAEARKLAESSKGLDIAKFQRDHKIYIMNVDELLKG